MCSTAYQKRRPRLQISNPLHLSYSFSYAISNLPNYNPRFLNNHYGSGSGRIWLDEVTCHGNESSIVNCPHDPFGVNDCSHSEDVSISCASSGSTSSTVPQLFTTTVPTCKYISLQSLLVIHCLLSCLYEAEALGMCNHLMNLKRIKITTKAYIPLQHETTHVGGSHWAIPPK